MGRQFFIQKLIYVNSIAESKPRIVRIRPVS